MNDGEWHVFENDEPSSSFKKKKKSKVGGLKRVGEKKKQCVCMHKVKNPKTICYTHFCLVKFSWRACIPQHTAHNLTLQCIPCHTSPWCHLPKKNHLKFERVLWENSSQVFLIGLKIVQRLKNFFKRIQVTRLKII